MTPPTVHITEGLLDVLLEIAADADPQETTLHLGITPADELGIEGLNADIPVFSDLYLPNTGHSIEAVFGMNVSVPPGRSPGIFVSHPTGPLDIRSTDEFAERIIVAVPPWTPGDVAVFDRRGREIPMQLHAVSEPVDV